MEIGQYIKGLDVDAAKEMIRMAAEEEMPNLAQEITLEQYEYAIETLPSRKAEELKEAFELIQKKV